MKRTRRLGTRETHGDIAWFAPKCRFIHTQVTSGTTVPVCFRCAALRLPPDSPLHHNAFSFTHCFALHPSPARASVVHNHPTSTFQINMPDTQYYRTEYALYPKRVEIRSVPLVSVTLESQLRAQSGLEKHSKSLQQKLEYRCIELIAAKRNGRTERKKMFRII